MPFTRRVRTARRKNDPRTLEKRRTWFADEDTPPGENGGDGGNETGDGGEKDGKKDFSALPEWARSEIDSLQNRLKEVNHESASRRHQLNEMSERLQKLEEQRQAGLSAEEKLREAQANIDSLKQFEDRAKKLEDMIRQSNEQRIAQIPEHMRSLVPDGSPADVAAYLDRNAALLTKPIAPDLDGGAGSGSGTRQPALTDEEKQIARRTGISEEAYAQRKAEIEARRQRREG